MVTKKAKKQFRQVEWDKLVAVRARAILALREARKKVNEYRETHTRGY